MASSIWEGIFKGLSEGLGHYGRNLLPYKQQQEDNKYRQEQVDYRESQDRENMLYRLGQAKNDEAYRNQILEGKELDRNIAADASHRNDIYGMYQSEQDTKQSQQLFELKKLIETGKLEETKRYHDLLNQQKDDNVTASDRLIAKDNRATAYGSQFDKIISELSNINADNIPTDVGNYSPGELRALVNKKGLFDEYKGSGKTFGFDMLGDDDDVPQSELDEIMQMIDRLGLINSSTLSDYMSNSKTNSTTTSNSWKQYK